MAALPHGTTAATGGLVLAAWVKALLVLLVAALFVVGARLAAPTAKTASPSHPPTTTHAPPPTPAPRAASAHDLPTIHDDDPKGALRVEGQVVDEQDAPVAHAMVAIDANPPIVVETDGDGAFAFEGLIHRDYYIEATAGDRYAGPARLRLSEKPEPITLRMHEGGSALVTVTDRASAAPVAGAEVELRSALTWKATTNADGVAKLTGLGAGFSPLVVRATGYAEAATMLRTSATPDPVEHLAVSVARGAALSGRVVDDTGKPIARARVVASSASEVLTVADPPLDAVLTDADGSFSIPVLSAGTWRITASSGDFAPTTTAPIAVDGEHARGGIEVELVPGSVVRGTVTDASGAPVPAADVSVVVHGFLPWRTRRQTSTDASGSFVIRGLERRAVDVVASHETGASAIVPVDLAANREQDVRLTLDLTAEITGTVVDERGQPLAGAPVIAEPESTGDAMDRAAWGVRGVQETVTDQGGEFHVGGLPGGSYTVRAARPGAAESALWLSTGVVTTPSSAPIRIVVAAEGRVLGRVRLADGKPVTAFTIALGNTRPRPISSQDGTFAVAAPAGTYALTVAGPGFVTTGHDVTVAAATDTDVGTLAVTAGRSISGRVLDETGMPVAGATVAAGSLLSGGGAELYIEHESIAAKDTRTDADGRFVLAGFPPASLTIVAGKPNAGRSASVQLPPGPDSVTLDLVLAATSSLAGKVTRNGQPLADTMIIASPIGAMWSNFFVTTGPDGAFAFDALAPGAYVVYPMLSRGGNSPGSMYMRRTDVVLGTKSQIEIDATPGPVTLAVSVKTDAGAPLPSGRAGTIQLSINPQTAEELRDGTQMPTDRTIAMHGGPIRDGAASIDGLQPGAQTLCAMIGDPRIASSVKLRCTQLTVTSAAKQSASLVVPAAWAD
jgi:protocatechuate 3,4-dioxygenase beta subunit